MFEEAGSEARLQRLDMPAHGRCARLQRPRRFRQAARPRDGQEVLEVIPFHAVSEMKTWSPNIAVAQDAPPERSIAPPQTDATETGRPRNARRYGPPSGR